MKGLGLGVLALTAALFLGWWSFVRAPSPFEVCDHVLDVTTAEAKAAGMTVEAEATLVESLQVSCIQHKLDKIQLRGRIKYARYAKCVLAGTSVAAIEGC